MLAVSAMIQIVDGNICVRLYCRTVQRITLTFTTKKEKQWGGGARADIASNHIVPKIVPCKR